MDLRDKLLDNWIKSKDTADKEKFKKFRNEVSHLQRKAKKQYFHKIANMKVDNSKQFFSNLKKNNIIDDKKKSSQEKCRFTTTDLNTEFLKNNNAKEDTEKVNEEIHKILDNAKNTEERFKFKEITEPEIIKIIIDIYVMGKKVAYFPR